MIPFVIVWLTFSTSSIDAKSEINVMCPLGENYNDICFDTSIEECLDEPDFFERCDIDKHLKCEYAEFPFIPLKIIERCKCQNGYKYNAAVNKCQGLDGSLCKPSEQYECIPTVAECVASEEDPTQGVCKCKEGLQPMEGGCYFGFGQPCNWNYSLQCGPPGYHLDCYSDTCKCSDSTFYYDKSLERCVPRIGVRCADTYPYCGSKGNCDTTNRICKCYNYNEPDYDGENCLKGNRDSCTNTSECGHFLYCDRGQCKCPDDFIAGGLRNERCSVPAGKVCSRDAECVKYSKCVDGICTCDSGFYPGTSGECFAEFSKLCEHDPIICDDFGHVSCNGWYWSMQVQKRCDCNNGYEYNRTTKKCQALHSSRCWVNVQNDCINNLICSNQSLCTCPPGLHVDSLNKECYATLGMDCAINHCMQSMNLKCQGGKCQCDSDAYFDNQALKCSVRLGSVCRPESDSNNCGTDAVCVDNKCKCSDPTLFPGPDNTTCVEIRDTNTALRFHIDSSIMAGIIIVIFLINHDLQ